MKKLGTLVFTLCVLSTTALAAPHVSMADARKIALTRVPGTIVHDKLHEAKKKKEHDHYTIKISPRDHKTALLKKVEIDAETGTILEVKDVKPKKTDD